MIRIDNLERVVAQIESERGIEKSTIVSAIEQALISASRKKYPETALIECELDLETGEADVFQVFHVVEEIEDEAYELTPAQAKSKKSDAKTGDVIREKITPSDFGRLAAQTAKQVIIQRIREAEKTAIFGEYESRIGEVLTGTVQRVENQNYLINLGRGEALLTVRNQIPGEKFSLKEKVRVFLEGIEKLPRGAQIKISRTHPDMLRRLFELEIPEIQDGIIEIMSVSREPGKRAKVAVKSNNASIGAVGTCVGHMGARIQAVIKELGFEKIDVLEWDENPKLFIANALKPAKISRVIITNADAKEATVVVPNDQLSLAIGKSGINVRLSVKLTGWKLDIINQDEFSARASEFDSSDSLSIVDKIKMNKGGLGDATAKDLPREGLSLQERLQQEKEKFKTILEQDHDQEDEGIKVADLANLMDKMVKDIVAVATELGIKVKNGQSVITEAESDRIKEKCSA